MHTSMQILTFYINQFSLPKYGVAAGFDPGALGFMLTLLFFELTMSVLGFPHVMGVAVECYRHLQHRVFREYLGL